MCLRHDRKTFEIWINNILFGSLIFIRMCSRLDLKTFETWIIISNLDWKMCGYFLETILKYYRKI